MIETTTIDIYSPFGAGAPTQTAVRARFSNAISTNRPTYNPKTNTQTLWWTHLVEVADDIDIRDGCTRTPNTNDIVYADGDEIRVAGLNASTRFVVVWVDRMIGLPGQPATKVAYLMRHEAAWPGP